MHLPNVSIFIQSFSQWGSIFSGEIILYTIVKCFIRLDFNPFYSALYTKVCNLETQPLIWVFNNLETYPESICNVMITTVDILSIFFQSYRICRIGRKSFIKCIVNGRSPLGCKSSISS